MVQDLAFNIFLSREPVMCWRVSMKATDSKQDLMLKAFVLLAMVGSLVSCVGTGSGTLVSVIEASAHLLGRGAQPPAIPNRSHIDQ
jgi:hypothetical protein